MLLVQLVIALPVEGKPPPIKSFVVYYGLDKAEQLERFDLVIVSPLLEEEVVRLLRDKGVLVTGYVSISTIGHWEPWRKFVSKDMIMGTEELWKETIVNVNDERWYEIILEKVIPCLLSKGFSGVFFDDLDIVDVYPQFKRGIVRIIKGVREQYENLIIIVNRGFSILDDIAPYIDGLLFECFGTYYNFTKRKYEMWSGDNLEWILSMSKKLKQFSEKYGFVVLALGYANLEDQKQLKEFMNYVNSLAKQFDFIPYVTDVYLEKVNLNYAKRFRIEKRDVHMLEMYYLVMIFLLALSIVIVLILKKNTLRR